MVLFFGLKPLCWSAIHDYWTANTPLRAMPSFRLRSISAVVSLKVTLTTVSAAWAGYTAGSAPTTMAATMTWRLIGVHIVNLSILPFATADPLSLPNAPAQKWFQARGVLHWNGCGAESVEQSPRALRCGRVVFLNIIVIMRIDKIASRPVVCYGRNIERLS